MKAHLEDTERRIISEQAAQWLCDLRQGGQEKQEAFLAWLKKSPRHVAEFLFAATVWREVRQVGLSESIDLEALAAEALEQERSNVVALEETLGRSQHSAQNVEREEVAKPQRRHLQPYGRRWAVAAAVVVLAGTAALGWWAVSVLTGQSTYATGVGEQRIVRLEDGSIIQLNTNSRAAVRYSERARDIELLEGEALFTVKRDAARPFRVDAGNSVIRAVGTQFNVYRGAQVTTVSVVEGKVRVLAEARRSLAPVLTQREDEAATTLAAGEEAHIAASGEISKHAESDIADALAWRERRLVFQGDKLHDVAREFNRYNERLIRVEGEAARDKLLSGTFDADDPDSLILFLEKLDDLLVESRGNEFVVRSRG